MDIDFVLVGQRIRDIRTMRGITTEVLSERVGLASESLRHIECGTNKPSLQALYRIAAVLDVSMDYITGRTPTLSDSLTSKYGLNAAQKQIAREVLDSIVPIIANHI